MNVLGIVAEYNPFHNGHKYHLEKSRALCNADAVICVMSGNFIQRGEPAIVDKWARAEMALLNGIDLVIELPAVYAMSSAEYFASGAIKILDSIGIVNKLSFGSEAGDIQPLDTIAGVLVSEPDEYKTLLKNCLSKGLSFPAARESALAAYLRLHNPHNIDIAKIIGSSNNILGIEYLKALKKHGSSIKPFTMERIANTYNSEKIQGSISSATSIRKLIMSSLRPNDISTNGSLKEVLPYRAFQILEREFLCGKGPVFANAFEAIILSKLRAMDLNDISKLPYITEGLENRIKSASENSGSLDELIENISTKRYTRTRIQRCLFSILTGLKNEDFCEFNSYGGPQYARILGFNDTGRQLISKMNKISLIPPIIKTADFKHSCNKLLSRMLHIEAASTDQYVLAYNNKVYRKSGQEFTRNLVLCQP